MLFSVSKVSYADGFCACILLNNKQLRILKCFSDAGEMCHSATEFSTSIVDRFTFPNFRQVLYEHNYN